MAESQEELKSLFMKVKEESEKGTLKLNIRKMKAMANTWGNNENSESFFGSKITADGDCSHEIKRCLLASWRKSYDKPTKCIGLPWWLRW